MRSTTHVLQVSILSVLLKMQIFTHAHNVTWHEIFNHLQSANAPTNFKSSCPWTHHEGKIQLIYNRCLDLDNITEFQPTFSREGLCQSIHSPCVPYTVGYTCVRAYPSVQNTIIGKRNEQKDPYMCDPVLPPVVNPTEDIRPIVRTIEAQKDMKITKSYITNNKNYGPNNSVDNETQVSHSSILALMFPSYISKNNAQFNQQRQENRPPVQRTFQETTGTNFLYDDNINT